MLTSQDIPAASLVVHPGEMHVNGKSERPPSPHQVRFDGTQHRSQPTQWLYTPPTTVRGSFKLLTGENSLLKFFAQNCLEFVALTGNPTVISQKGRLPMN